MSNERWPSLVVGALVVCAFGLGAAYTVTLPRRPAPCVVTLEDVGSYLEAAVNRIESAIEGLARRDDAGLPVPSYSDATHGGRL